MKKHVFLLGIAILAITSCKQIDSGKMTIINTTPNAVSVVFNEDYNSQEIVVPGHNSVERPWTRYVSVYPARTEKYVYGKESGNTYTIYARETKTITVYVTNTTSTDLTVVNTKDPTSGEFSVVTDAKNIKLEIPYIIGFELAIKELDPPVLSIMDHKQELINEDGTDVLRDFYLIRSPGY